MSGVDVEALLESTAKTASKKEEGSKASPNGDADHGSSRNSRDRHRDSSRGKDKDKDRDRDRDRDRDGRRDRDRKYRERSAGHRDSPRRENGRATPRSDAGSQKSRRRSRSRDEDRRHSRRSRNDGDYYRSGRGHDRSRSRSRSPHGRYRGHGGRDERRGGHRDDDRRRHEDRDRHRSGRQGSPREATPPALTEDERDRRTVFVQQLAARLRTKELKDFFEKAGPVAEAQIVKDRVSNRSKGYVYFSSSDKPAIIMLTVSTELAMWSSKTKLLSLLLSSLLVKSS
jgi:RNA-binding protein 39